MSMGLFSFFSHLRQVVVVLGHLGNKDFGFKVSETSSL